MFIFVFFTFNLCVATLFDSFFDKYSNDNSVNDFDSRNEHMYRSRTEKIKKFDFKTDIQNCEMLSHTEKSPFIVIVLFKSSGNFLGMGAIIDKKTAITAEKVVKLKNNTPNNLLLLAGSLSPWWGRNSQVRNVHEIIFSQSDVALMIINTLWRFNKFLAPISLPEKFYPVYKNVFGIHNYEIFGIDIEHIYLGSKVPKSKKYYMSTESLCLSRKCGGEVVGAHIVFNISTQFCLCPNASFCLGAIGSPVVAVDIPKRFAIVGVLIWTGCVEQAPFHRAVKLVHLDKWIRAFSLLGYEMQK